ncbi:MAG: hypothetical protein WED33_08565 [Bacteroidia bacterium]
MTKIAFILMLCFSVLHSFAQQNAITDTGEEVILFKDGTWVYVEEQEVITLDEIEENPLKFKQPKESSFLLKSQRVDVGFWIDPKLWKFKKSEEDADAEYLLQLKDGDLYAMIISEKVEIPLDALMGIALENARNAAPDIKIVRKEFRNVNGLKVLLLQMDGTLQGIKFSYYGYYYSFEGGTVQFISYTSQNLLEEYLSTCEDLLNGIFKID